MILTDLKSILADPGSWDHLDQEDLSFIASICPPSIPIADNGRIEPFYLKYDDNWRGAVRRFQEDLSSGRMEPEWLEEAHEAMEERARGDFDDWKEQEFEEFWGQKQKVDWSVLSGESAKVKLQTMVQEGLFKVGDVFAYAQVFGKGKDRVLVDKDCEVGRLYIVCCGRKRLTRLR